MSLPENTIIEPPEAHTAPRNTIISSQPASSSMSIASSRNEQQRPVQQNDNPDPMRLRGGCIPCPGGGMCFIIPCPCF
ncbi:hypothetical protein BJ138DRAFT_1155919 [Hygrophoropsis aurantiaca]|uniref:Uncharacterized protein n=1 Tax=Hygrophoropsis aurantiaca TaxID=72124 RepID=A0ACB8A7Z7_9AGAM|nr:hypothetical protein BJ138DRAFT_1155919 [Hygrophoropsis aurantiaca]